MSLQCGNDAAQIGQTCEKRIPVLQYAGFYFHSASYSFTNAAALATEATVKAAVVAGNVLPVQNVIGVEGQDVEKSVETTSLGVNLTNFKGRRGARYMFDMPYESYKTLMSYADLNLRVIYIDINGTLHYMQNDDGTVQGFALANLDVMNLGTPTVESRMKVMVDIQEDDSNEVNEYGYYMNPTYNPRRIYGALTVQLTLSSLAAGSVTATVKYVNQAKHSAAGADVETAILGLDAGTNSGFKIVQADGTVLTSTTDFTVAEDDPVTSPGVYTITEAGSATLGAGDEIRVEPTTTLMYKSAYQTVAT